MNAVTQHTVDVFGVGFGPAGLSVAVALDDLAEDRPAGPAPRSRFADRAPGADWQPNMLLPGTDIQHHFLRDYATPRNPRSRFTFPSYLVDTGRFFPFTLMGGYVSREEWSNYTRWTAERVTAPVDFGTDVCGVEPVRDADGRVRRARITAVSGDARESEYLASNVLVSVGHTPFVPEQFRPVLGDRVFHSSRFRPRIEALSGGGRLRFAVVGAGQNAGEIVLHLASAYPEAEIHSLVRNSGFRTYNLGHFSNEAYFPDETEYFYGLNADARRRVFDEVYTTNYACVDPDVSTALYRAAYEDHYWGRGRLSMRKRTSVDAIAPGAAGGYRLTLREVNTGAVDELDADVVILCTGYREPHLPAMLEPFRDLARFDASGEPEVSRAYRLETGPECAVGIYLNGITEWRHGINSATSFSTMAIKAGEIADDLVARRGAAEPSERADAAAVALTVG